MGYKINCRGSVSVSPGKRQLYTRQVTNGSGPMKDFSEMDSNTTETFLAVFGVLTSD